MLSRKKLALDPRLVTTQYRWSPDAAPRCSEPLDPGIGGSGVGKSSSGPWITRIVEPVTSLRETAGKFGRETGSELSSAGDVLGNGGISELSRTVVTVKEGFLM